MNKFSTSPFASSPQHGMIKHLNYSSHSKDSIFVMSVYITSLELELGLFSWSS